MTINNDVITKNAEIILTNVSDFNNEINKLNSVIDSINLAWEGADALKYINAMKDAYIPRLQNLSEEINQFGQGLWNIPKLYQALDDMFGNKNIDI